MPLDLPAATRHLARSDPVMRRIVKSIGPCELKPGGRGDHFTTLMRAIVGQQLSVAAAATIWNRVLALYPGRRNVRPEDIAAAKPADLRGAGLSNAKIEYCKDLATRVIDGRLPLSRLSRRKDEDIITELVAVKGIGRWTAEMFLIFKLGRPDVWPIDDLGLRNAVKHAYNIEPTKTKLVALAEPWRPWRSVASWYLWRTLANEPVAER